MTKKELRQIMLVKRNDIPNRKRASNQARFLLKTILDNYKVIALYYPIRDEIDVIPLLEEYRSDDSKTVCLPAIQSELVFKKYTLQDALIQKPFNTYEVDTKQVVDLDSIEVIVIPCIAVDKSSHRLGYGKGYYDKALQHYKGIKIGITYEIGLLDFDFYEDHDIQMNYVVTENQIIKVGERNV